MQCLIGVVSGVQHPLSYLRSGVLSVNQGNGTCRMEPVYGWEENTCQRARLACPEQRLGIILEFPKCTNMLHLYLDSHHVSCPVCVTI